MTPPQKATPSQTRAQVSEKEQTVETTGEFLFQQQSSTPSRLGGETSQSFPRGSEWRKWDFAVRPPRLPVGDKGFAAFAQSINSSMAEVVGIFEPYSVAGYCEIINSSTCSKTLFPVIGLKSFANNKGKGFAFRILLDNDTQLLPHIEKLLDDLPCHTTDGQRALLKEIDPTVRESGEAFVDFLEVITRLKDNIHLRGNYLIILPYANRGIAPAEDNIFSEGLIDLVDMIDSADAEHSRFFQWKSDVHAPEVVRLWLNRRKLPCIAGSEKDASDPTFGKLTAPGSLIESYCWVKADPTFDGLKQVLADPDRVYFGKRPEILARVQQQGAHSIRSLAFNKVSSNKDVGQWFDGLDIPVSSELTAIIGNKGSGKSALVDILGLLGNAQSGDFSFLTKDKFRKKNLAGNFAACLTWADGSTSESKTLDTDPDITQPEHIKYIPQNHFEKLCNYGGDAFEDEVQNVIYNHLEAGKRLGTSSFRELIAKKRALADETIASKQHQLTKLNKQIIALEEKSTETYRNKILHQLEKKQKELAAHEDVKPAEVANPEINDDIQRSFAEISDHISKLREELVQTQQTITQKQAEKQQLEQQHADLSAFIAKWEKVSEGVGDWKAQGKELMKNVFGLNIDTVVKFEFRKELVEKKLAAIEKTLADIELQLAFVESQNPSAAEKKSLYLQCAQLESEIDSKIGELDVPHQLYQQYLTDLKAWEDHKQALLGDKKTSATVRYFEGILDYLDKKLDGDLQKNYAERRKLAQDIYQQKRDIYALYSELKAPVSSFLAQHADLIRDYNISLDVDFRISGFAQSASAFIDTAVSGTFQANPLEQISDMLLETDPGNKQGLIALLDSIIDGLQFARTQKKAVRKFIHSQVKNGRVLELYDYLFGLEYLQPEYELRLDGKPLSELSPGERGSLLLVFYLMIDKDETPLILDQPEDNLDNQSISKILVPFLRRAKARRQVIMVTHNPNLAVLADAEQIIRVRIHKDKDHQVEIVSGAIENPIMNRHILDVLEGTEQAFTMRGRKYTFSGK